MPQSDYNVNINIKAKDSTKPDVPKAATGFEKLAKAAKIAAKVAGGVFAAIQAAKVVTEMVKIGAAAERQEDALMNLAAAADESGTSIIKAIQGASDYTIDRMSAMEAANRAMVMDVADSPAEFERLTKVAVALGRAMGVDAAKSIDDFVTASARSSVQIADNLGLVVTVEAATTRYADSLGIAADELTDAQKKQAFLNMMLEEGEKKMADLGDQTLDTAGKLEQTSTAWDDVKTSVNQAAAAVADATGILDKVGTGARTWANDVEIFSNAIQKLRDGATIKEALFEVGDNPEQYKHLSSEIERYGFTQKQAGEVSRFAHLNTTQAVEQETVKMSELSFVTDETKDSLNDAVISQGMMEHTAIAAAKALEQEVVAVDEFVKGMDAAAQLNLSMNFTRTLDQMAESSAQFAQDRETIEAEHQEKIAALQARGAAKTVTLNLEAEQRKLDNLKWARDQAQLKVSEMTGKEKESSQNAKQHALETAQSRYAEQQKLLEDYSAGRLVTAGQNVDALIAEEVRRKDAAIAALDEQMAKQQEVQDQAMGQMMLQAFDAWSDQKDIPVEKMLEMRTAIAEEYGLVSEGATGLVTDMVGEWDRWAEGTKVSTEEVVDYLGVVIDETGKVNRELVELTAEEYVIKVRYELIDEPPDVPGKKKIKDDEELSASISVGNLPVFSGTGATYNTSNQDTINVYDWRAMAAINEDRRRRRRTGIARTM